jgi:hypothetical protein
MAINFGGNVYDDAGNAVSGASVKLLETGTTTQEGSTVTTDSDGRWDFAEGDQDRYDIEITKGSSVRRIKWGDEISLQEIDVRNNTGNTTPAATFTNLTNNPANQVAVFSGANSTKAADDEIYLSFKMADSAGNIDEFARMTVVATDVTSGSEDGQFEFDVLQGGSLIKAFTIASSTAGAQSIDFNQDSITFGTGTAATDITLTFDAESADGVITWMEDEDYFKFSDDILMTGTERINLGDTGTYIYQSTDGQLDLVADTEIQIAATTIDINGAVALNGAITGATDITLSGELDAATLDISGNADIDGTLEADAYTVDGVTLAEYISDTAGAMFSSNTETGIAVTYQDGDNTIDLALSAAQTTITSLLATDIKIGEDDQTKIDFEDANTINFYANNAKEVVLAENSISPGTSDGTALGTTSLMWSDLFLASGSVINFNNGDVTLTHSSNTLTAAGGTFAAAAITGTTIDATTDFTIGDTVITDGVITDSTGLALAANVTVTGNVLPNADDTYDLGSASAAWQDLFLEGDITLTDAGSITTSAGNLTLAAATGADVLLGDNATILYVDGGNGFVGVGIAPAAQMQVKLASNVDFSLSAASGSLRVNAVNDAVSATVGLEFNASSFKILSGVMTVGGNIVPASDSSHDLGTQTSAQWANVWSDLVNGADYGYDNGWRSLEADTYDGYGTGIAFDFGSHFTSGKALSVNKVKTGTKQVEETNLAGDTITKTVDVYARQRVTNVSARPKFAVTEDFIEYMGVRVTPQKFAQVFA